LAHQIRKFDRLLWPVLIAVCLALVILINALFIYVAVAGRDDVVPSYQTESR